LSLVILSDVEWIFADTDSQWTCRQSIKTNVIDDVSGNNSHVILTSNSNTCFSEVKRVFRPLRCTFGPYSVLFHKP